MALFISKTIFGKTDSANPYFVIAKNNKNDIKIDTKHELESFCNVYGLDYHEFPNKKWLNIANALGIINPRWEMMMPTDEYESILISYIGDLFSQIKEKTIDKFWYYSNIVSRERSLLGSFQTVCFSDNTEHSPYTYKRTAAGRLVSDSGVNLFQMNQDRREQVLDSRFNDGKIVSIDFKALEPRVMLAIQNPSFLENCEDVYAKISDYTSLDVSRETIKLCLLKVLNNSSIHGIREGTLLTQVETIELKTTIHELFQYDKKVNELEEQFVKNDRIFNHFGRPHRVEGNNKNILFTYFMQSTSAEVCIVIFSKITRLIESAGLIKKIVPIGMIYDSLILDVNYSELESINSIVQQCNVIKIGNRKFEFPMSINVWKKE